jgi:hypothetical protein
MELLEYTHEFRVQDVTNGHAEHTAVYASWLSQFVAASVMRVCFACAAHPAYSPDDAQCALVIADVALLLST